MNAKILAAGMATLIATASVAQTTQTTTHHGSGHKASALSHNPAIKDSDPARIKAAADGRTHSPWTKRAAA